MKNRLKLLVWLFALSGPLAAQSVSVNGPDGKLQLTVSCPSANGEVSYAVTYNGKQMLESSPLGMETNVGKSFQTSASGDALCSSSPVDVLHYIFLHNI